MRSELLRSAVRRAVSSAALLGLAASGPALAEGADQAASSQLGEIVVTSQKMAEGISNQDVPAAITAFDASAIERNFAVDLRDLGRLTPNVQLNQVSTFNGYANFYIRGIGINGSTRTVDPAVGLFVDGLYVGFGPSSLVDTFDLASVEVLRGPQGTLFGRNVTGGAVVVNTAAPSQEFAASAKVTYGNYDRFDVAAVVNGGLTETVSARLAAIYQHQEGYFSNLENGQKKANKNLTLVRPSLRFEPSEDFDLTIRGEWQQNVGGPATSQNIVNPVFPKLAQTLFGYIPPADKYDVRHNLQGYSNTEVKQLAAEANWNLGHGLVTAVAGWRDVRFDSSTDFDGSPITLFHFKDNKETQDQRSVELRYASKFSDRYRFTVGTFWFDQSFFVGERRETFAGIVNGNVTIANTAGITNQDQNNLSLFAEGSVDLTEQWSLTLGGRYTKEEKEIEFVPPGRCALDFSSCTIAPIPGKKDWSNFSPKVGVNWKPSEELLGYASWTRGFRSGVFNQRAQFESAIGPSEPEVVDSYEVGLKSQFLDNRLRVNVALFSMKYDDIQKILNESCDPDGAGPAPPTSCQLVRNAAKATISGAEFELNALASDRLSFDLALGYTDAKYDEFPGIDVTGDGRPDPELAKELEFEKVPEFTGYLGANYAVPVGADDTLTFRGSYSYTSKFYTDQFNRDWLAQDGYGLLDASVTFARGERWQASLWGKNLTDEEYIDFAADVGTLGSWVFGGEPRRYGVEFKMNF
jgi:iron complex outermembrane receptor protein